jgi:hypothetical protein
MMLHDSLSLSAWQAPGATSCMACTHASLAESASYFAVLVLLCLLCRILSRTVGLSSALRRCSLYMQVMMIAVYACIATTWFAL